MSAMSYFPEVILAAKASTMSHHDPWPGVSPSSLEQHTQSQDQHISGALLEDQGLKERVCTQGLSPPFLVALPVSLRLTSPDSVEEKA